MLTKESLDRALRRFLHTRQDPRHLGEGAARDEVISQIVDTLHGHQPDDADDAWFSQISERATMQTKGWGWPTPETWARCVGATNQKWAEEKPADTSLEVGTTHYGDRIFAERIHKGEAVGEPNLFGERADRCLADGRITLGLLRKYQRAAYYRKKSQYSAEYAREWLREKCPPLFAEIFPILAGKEDPRLPADPGAGDTITDKQGQIASELEGFE